MFTNAATIAAIRSVVEPWAGLGYKRTGYMAFYKQGVLSLQG